jgi:hypothetical protein
VDDVQGTLHAEAKTHLVGKDDLKPAHTVLSLQPARCKRLRRHQGPRSC